MVYAFVNIAHNRTDIIRPHNKSFTDLKCSRMQKQNCIHPCILLFAQKQRVVFVNIAHIRAFLAISL